MITLELCLQEILLLPLQGGYVLQHVCLDFFGLSEGLHKNYVADLHETLMKAATQPIINPINFWLIGMM